MKGDHCPFDHGNDAVVVDESSLATSTDGDGKPQPSIQTVIPSIPIPPPMIAMPPMQVRNSNTSKEDLKLGNMKTKWIAIVVLIETLKL